MKSIFLSIIIIMLTHSSFAQKFDKRQISQKSELNLSFESKFRGIIKNDVIYYVEKDMQTLSAYYNGKPKWKTNIIAICGKPYIGKPEIRVIKLKTDKMFVVFGKHSFAEVDLSTGKTKYLGSD